MGKPNWEADLNITPLISLLSSRNLHKLAGTALGAFGLTTTNWRDLTIGAAYAAVMHVVGGIKKVADGA